MGEDFEIAIPDSAVADLEDRLWRTRWPPPMHEKGWDAGTEEMTLRRLVERWRAGYDWRAHERDMNRLDNRRVELDNAQLHYVRFAGASTRALPLLLSHGWPGSFLEIVPLAERLSAAGFEVIVPSLPGFGFSDQRPEATDPWSTPELFHRLMKDVLGHSRYVAHGGDLGAGIATRLAGRHPEAVAGAHLLAVAPPSTYEPDTLTDAERAHLEQQQGWNRDEGAYQHQQQTRPITLAYGLTDSPVGLLAWIVEKLRAWSDCDGDLSRRFSDDEVLTWVSLYWFTDTIASGFRPYSDAYRRSSPPLQVDVPTAVAVFPADLAQPPREWAMRSYDVRRFTEMPRGGHFAAFEEPDLLAEDIIAFASEL